MNFYASCYQLRSQLRTSAFLKISFIPLVLFALTACVTVEKHTLPPDSEINKQAVWQAHQANIQTLKTWKLKGRAAGKSKGEGFRAGVHWSQFPTNYIIDLHGPLGRKVAVISGRHGNVQLRTSKGERFEAQDAEELMQQLFGYSLPVNGLQYWLLGIPDPATPHTTLELDDQGRLLVLKQSGWAIEYKRYHLSDPVLPGLIYISNATLNANIKIDHWEINSQ